MSGEDIQFPHLDIAGLSCEEKETLKGRLIEESRAIILKFQKLVNIVQKSLHERNIPVPTLASRLCSLGAFTSVVPNKPLLEECLPQIRAASNTEDAFWILRDYFSFFNYHIIEHIIHELGTDDDQRQFYTYMEAFKEYSKRRCIEFPHALQLGCPNKKSHVKLCVKLDVLFKQYRIEELQAFRSWLSKTLGVSEGALHLCFIGEGCIQFIFEIPLFVKEAIFPLSPEQERALLENGVVEVECYEYKFAKKVCEFTIPNIVYNQSLLVFYSVTCSTSILRKVLALSREEATVWTISYLDIVVLEKNANFVMVQ